jgi:hypothetical protein
LSKTGSCVILSGNDDLCNADGVEAMCKLAPHIKVSGSVGQWMMAMQGNTGQYSTAQYSTVQHSTVQYSTVQYSTVQCSAVQYSTVQHSIEQCSTKLAPYIKASGGVQFLWGSMQHNGSTVQGSAVQ